MKYSKEWNTKQEFNDIINNPEISRRDELIISVLYWCTLRVSEMAVLKIKDIDIVNRTLTLWQSKKSDDPELVPIPGHLIKQISQWIREKKLSPEKITWSGPRRAVISPGAGFTESLNRMLQVQELIKK